MTLEGGKREELGSFTTTVDPIFRSKASRQFVAARSFGSDATPYQSFWQAGFEGADHINGRGEPLCMQTQTGHLRQIRGDYRRLAALNMFTVRESVGWRRVQRGRTFDFSCVRAREKAAREQGIQIAWTLCHYGMPSDVDVFAPSFVERFADFCHIFAKYLSRITPGVRGRIYTPINEISFLSWAITHTGLMYPHRGNRCDEGYALKNNLVAAVIAGCRAIRAIDPQARFLHVDPLIHIVAPRDRPDLRQQAALMTSYQFQAWDLLGGRLEPKLGGGPDILDLIGVNYYHGNQWECETLRRLHWHENDFRRRPLTAMLVELHRRYRRPLTISETSHVGSGRAVWLSDVYAQTQASVALGSRVLGICLYPAIDRPDWQDSSHWHHSGLWDIDPADPDQRRRLDPSYANALSAAQQDASAMQEMNR